eukprot:gene49582-66417_t
MNLRGVRAGPTGGPWSNAIKRHKSERSLKFVRITQKWASTRGRLEACSRPSSQEETLMSEIDKVFAGSIPKFYDTLMVPLIFEAYAVDMAELVASYSPGSVLETAAGSGVVTRALAPRLAPGTRYVVTDLNQPMLDYAASRQAADGRVNIEWQQADALKLPFEDASFDV